MTSSLDNKITSQIEEWGGWVCGDIRAESEQGMRDNQWDKKMKCVDWLFGK